MEHIHSVLANIHELNSFSSCKLLSTQKTKVGTWSHLFPITKLSMLIFRVQLAHFPASKAHFPIFSAGSHAHFLAYPLGCDAHFSLFSSGRDAHFPSFPSGINGHLQSFPSGIDTHFHLFLQGLTPFSILTGLSPISQHSLLTYLFVTVVVSELEVAVICSWWGCGGGQVIAGGGDVWVGEDLEETHQVHHNGLLIWSLYIDI